MILFYKKEKKHNEIELTINNMVLNNQKCIKVYKDANAISI